MSAPVMSAAGGQVYHPRQARNMLIILAGMALMVTYVETMVLPAYGNFVTFFDNAPTSTVVWILSAYLLVGVVATPVFGKLGDIYGKKKMLLVAMGVYAAAVSVAGFTPNIGDAFGVPLPNQIYLLIGARAVQGIGMGMFPLAFAMIPEFFPANRVGPAQGIVSAMFAGGACIGLVVGGWLAQAYGWPLTYHTVIPAAVGLLILAWFILRESPTLTGERLDLPGISSLGLALTFLMLAVTESTYWGWTSLSGGTIAGVAWGVPEFLVLSVLLFAFFGYWETRAPSPVIRLRSLKVRNILVSNITAVVAGLMLFIVFTTLTILVEAYYFPALSQTGFGQSELWFGLIALPSAAGMLATGLPLGRLTSRYGPKPVMILGFALASVGGLLLTQYANPSFQITLVSTSSGIQYLSPVLVSYPQPVPLILLLAPVLVLVGTVAVLIAMSNIIVLSVGPRELGVQTGMNQTFRNLGSAIGPVLVSSILAAYIFNAVGPFDLYSTLAYQYCFLVLAVVAAIGLVSSFYLRNYRFESDGTRSDTHANPLAGPGAEPRAIFPTEPKA
ncbi:MAG: MFS transporter [Thermoplasmata archaeon]